MGFREAVFKWVSHFLSSFVLFTHQTLLWSLVYCSVRVVLEFWIRLQRNRHFGAIWVLTIAPPSVDLIISAVKVRACKDYIQIITERNAWSSNCHMLQRVANQMYIWHFHCASGNVPSLLCLDLQGGDYVLWKKGSILSIWLSQDWSLTRGLLHCEWIEWQEMWNCCW